jgi:hypothetical protein
LKPYTGDLLCAGFSVFFAQKLGRSLLDANRIAIVAWFIMISIPFFFSQSYILVAPALLSTIGIVYWKTIRNNSLLVSAALIFPTIGALFSYYRDIRETQNEGLLDYWQYGMIGGVDFLGYLKSVLDRVFDLTVGWWVVTDTVMLSWIPIVLFGLVCGGLVQGLIEVFRHRGGTAKRSPKSTIGIHDNITVSVTTHHPTVKSNTLSSTLFKYPRKSTPPIIPYCQ